MWLHDGPSSSWPMKARALAEAAVAGLPVPRGIVIPLRAEPPIPTLSRLVASGPVIARTALFGEDEPSSSAAGLGQSRSGLRTLDDLVEALAYLRKSCDDPFLEFYRGPSHRDDAVIVQRQVDRRFLVVGALLPRGVDYIEVHEGPGDLLAHGATPTFAGRLRTWPERELLADLFRRVRNTFDPGPHGLDVEVVVSLEPKAHLVQLRLLTAPLHADGDRFLAMAGPVPHGTLTLDAEHNPAPLSPAHAWLMDWLARNRPRAGDPVVLAGWLYVRKLVRELATPSRDAAPTSARAVLEELDTRFIPAARDRLREIEASLVLADRRRVAALVDEAIGAFARMIDVYLDVLVPARARIGRHHVVNANAPLTTRGRAAFADVLPTAWDIASPALSEVRGFDAVAAETVPAGEEEAAVLLTEWDDHLFALGLAPLRRVYLRAAVLLGLADEVFMLTPPELQHALTEAVPGLLITHREEQQRRFEMLKPPLRIEDGFPAPLLRHARLRGLPIGTSVEGIVAQRRDLAALLADPPDPGAIVVMPTLTAQAALALQNLGVQAVCCEYGGAMSHAALMARELQLSALIGCRACTELPDGIRARVDTTLGRLLVAD